MHCRIRHFVVLAFGVISLAPHAARASDDERGFSVTFASWGVRGDEFRAFSCSLICDEQMVDLVVETTRDPFDTPTQLRRLMADLPARLSVRFEPSRLGLPSPTDVIPLSDGRWDWFAYSWKRSVLPAWEAKGEDRESIFTQLQLHAPWSAVLLPFGLWTPDTDIVPLFADE